MFKKKIIKKLHRKVYQFCKKKKDLEKIITKLFMNLIFSGLPMSTSIKRNAIKVLSLRRLTLLCIRLLHVLIFLHASSVRSGIFLARNKTNITNVFIFGRNYNPF